MQCRCCDVVDRLLIARARAERLVIITTDARFTDCGIEVHP
jgi:PIN domain nuclease of toxin-antitoxin system